MDQITRSCFRGNITEAITVTSGGFFCVSRNQKGIAEDTSGPGRRCFPLFNPLFMVNKL